MKIGVPVFGYDGFANFSSRLSTQGHFTVNLGDNMQSIAIRSLLQRLGVSSEDIVSVDRDTLAAYAGPSVALVMNGVFPARCFPLPPQVKPVFIGLCVTEKTVVLHRDFFSSHQPIGCRDTHTADLFTKHGIAAFVSGCLTMSLPERPAALANGARKTLIIYGAGAGAFPSSALAAMPPELLQDAEFVSQRIPVFEFPLDRERRGQVERYAEVLLEYYAENAALVVTSLHHAAAPCMALGIPVILCRQHMDARFSYLAGFAPVHTPGSFDRIDWNPGPADLTAVRKSLESMVSERVRML